MAERTSASTMSVRKARRTEAAAVEGGALPSALVKALADGALPDVSRSLMIAFSAVILALLAAAISFTVVNVRKRWYAVDLAAIEAELAGQAAPQAPPATVMPLKKQEAAA